MAQVRYIVHDVSAAVAFYTTHLGFAVVQQFGPAMAILKKDDLTLWVAGPAGNVVELFEAAAVPPKPKN